MFSVLHIDVRASWEIGIEERKASVILLQNKVRLAKADCVVLG